MDETLSFPAVTPSSRSIGTRARYVKARDPRVIVELARRHTTQAIKTIYELMLDTDQPGPVRLRAAELMIERGYGKAPQAVLVASDDATKGTGVHELSVAERIAAILMERSGQGMVTDLEASQVSDPIEIVADVTDDEEESEDAQDKRIAQLSRPGAELV